MASLNSIYTGEALTTLQNLPDNFVQCCISSPPYFGLRDYGIPGQIGLEETPDEYVTKLVEVFREVRRVLRNDGTLWLNLGDSYAAGKTGRDDSGDNGRFGGPRIEPKQRSAPPGLKPKDLIGIPWLVAFALRNDGWYLRSSIIWHKPNCMPESVEDRPTTAHESIFLLAKNEKYYYDSEAIKEENSPTSAGNRKAFRGAGVYTNNQSFHNSNPMPVTVIPGMANEWTGRNKRSVWTVPTAPYNSAHFATFPPKLIEPCILAGSSSKACEQCGAPWERVTVSTGHVNKREPAHVPFNVLTKVDSTGWAPTKQATNEWQPTCTCPGNTGAAHSIVLDPFLGAGTVSLVAIKHHRDWLGIELNPDYVTLAEKRIAAVQQTLWESEAVS